MAVYVSKKRVSHRLGRPPLSIKERQWREKQVVRLRQKGYSNGEIAQKTGLTIGQVNKTASKLLQKKSIEDRHKKQCSYDDIKSKRVKTIIRLKRRIVTLEEIGCKLHVTKERARQITEGIIKKHGEGVFTPTEDFWTAKEAANELGWSCEMIRDLCRLGSIPHRRIGLKGKGKILLDSTGMSVLRNHPAITRKRVCAVCKNDFIASRYGQRITCSEECRKIRKLEARIACLKKGSRMRPLRGSNAELWQRIKNHKVPSSDDWLTITEASLLADRSKMQITWLRMRGILTVRPHPFKKWRGRPVMTFSASQLNIVKEVNQENKNSAAGR